jgi:hypothetical protein
VSDAAIRRNRRTSTSRAVITACRGSDIVNIAIRAPAVGFVIETFSVAGIVTERGGIGVGFAAAGAHASMGVALKIAYGC